MAEHPVWRGQLRLALVSCPIALHTAQRDRGNLHFHFINPKTGHRVRMATLDAETDEDLNRRDLVKGYEYEKDKYLILDNEDFDRAKIDSSSTMSIDKFVPADAIDPVYFDGSYYCTPDGDSGTDVYVVLRDAIRESGRVALTRVVISRRERAVVIMPMENGLVAHVLREARDIADPKTLFEDIPATRPDPDMVKLATQLIDRQAAAFDPADMEDRYESRLREVIEAKLHGKGLEPEAPPAQDGNVIDLMAALRRSLGQAPDSRAESRAPGRASPGGDRPASKKQGETKASPKKGAAVKKADKAAPKEKAPARKRA